MPRRTMLKPQTASTEGERRLRELLRTMSAAAIARKLRSDESSVRAWARGRWLPNFVMRARLKDAFGIVEDTWEAPTTRDAYTASDAATTRRST